MRHGFAPRPSRPHGRLCRESVHRTSPGLVADHPHRDRRAAVPHLCGVAAGARTGARPQARVPECAVQRHHARRTLFPGRQRLHADLRPDAQRQSGARLALPVRRLFRLRDRGLDRKLDRRADRRLRRRRADRHRAAVHHLPLDGGSGSAADAGDDRALADPRRPDALALGRRFLSGADARLARRPGAAAARHRDALERRDTSICSIRWCASSFFSARSSSAS